MKFELRVICPKYDAFDNNLFSIKFDASFGVYRRLGENRSRMGIFKKVALRANSIVKIRL